MRFGWIVSLIVHVGLALITLVGWPRGETRESIPVNVVPVEIMTLAQASDVRAIAPPEEETAPEPEEAAPEPPTPAAAETEAPPPPAPRPLNLAELQRDLLRDRSKERSERTTPRQTPGDRGPRPRAGAGLSQGEAVALRDRIAALARAHMARNRCWRAPVDAPDPARLVVLVRFRLDARGHVQGRPEVVSPTSLFGDPELRVAVDRAVRAVLQCDPFPFADDVQAREHYDLWREMEMNFDPREMAG